ncbi:hypothetical protein NMY22_g19070 [Coprinellus aureogranulatus]|nr:hypothetical protein NMY22_g19070 [Coprinellus aureogranulatus]
MPSRAALQDIAIVTPFHHHIQHGVKSRDLSRTAHPSGGLNLASTVAHRKNEFQPSPLPDPLVLDHVPRSGSSLSAAKKDENFVNFAMRAWALEDLAVSTMYRSDCQWLSQRTEALEIDEHAFERRWARSKAPFAHSHVHPTHPTHIPHSPMFRNSSNFRTGDISHVKSKTYNNYGTASNAVTVADGGNYTNTNNIDVKAEVYNHHEVRVVDPLRELYAQTVVGAMHNSEERAEAPKCHPETRKAVNFSG